MRITVCRSDMIVRKGRPYAYEQKDPDKYKFMEKSLTFAAMPYIIH